MKRYRPHSLIVALATLLYLFTLAPTLIAGDSAAFSVNVFRFSLSFGSAVDHPLHIFLGRIFSWLPFEPAYTLNLMSAFFGVLTVLTIFLVIKELTESVYAAAFGALSLMVSHAFWQHAVVAEVYTLNAFFVALLLYIACSQLRYRRFWALFPLVVMLGLLNHLILALVVPPLLLYILVKIDAKPRRMILLGGAGLAGSLLVLLLGLFFFRTQAMQAWIHAILAGPPPIKHYLYPPAGLKPFLKELLFYLLYLVYQYPLGGVLLGIFGLIRLAGKDRAAAALLVLMMLFNGLFFVKTTSWGSYGGTKYTFYISDYTVFAVLVGYGAWAFLTTLEAWGKNKKGLGTLGRISIGIIGASVLLSVCFYMLMPFLVSVLDLDLLHARTLPYRDNNRFFLNPNKSGYYGDRQFGEEILELSRENAVVFADFTPETVLRYLQVIERKRPDLTVIRCDEKMKLRRRIDAVLERNPETPVYLADDNSYYNLKGFEERYELLPYGTFFEVIPRT